MIVNIETVNFYTVQRSPFRRSYATTPESEAARGKCPTPECPGYLTRAYNQATEQNERTCTDCGYSEVIPKEAQ